MQLIQFFFCLLATTTYLMRGVANYKIVPNGTIWLGESITLITEKIKDMTRPVVWESNGAKYECDVTCSTGANYRVTDVDDVSTLWIKNVSWEYSKWKFSDAKFHMGEIDMEINVKPKIKINNNTNCESQVLAKCSLPQTSVECFNGKDSVVENSNKKECPDGKTFTTTANVKFTPGEIKCHFTIASIFNYTETIKVVKCDDTNNFVTEIIIGVVVGALILMIIAVILYKVLKNRSKPDKNDFKLVRS